MKIQLPVIILSFFVLWSCNFRKSVSIDSVTGLSTQGDGLSCGDVYLSDGEQKLNRNSFVYGEKFYLNFDDIGGLESIGDNTFPGMKLLVVSQAGDTVLKNDDMYASYTDGINISPLTLQTNITAADPIHSGNEYTLYVNIWDKKGEGTFNAQADFEVMPNEQISIESKGISYGEVYLYSQEQQTTLTGNTAKFDETVYLMFEGMEGFKEEDGKLFPGVSMKIKDADGALILSEEDLAAGATMDPADLRSQLATNFIINDHSIKNPVTCEVVVWDKKSENSIKASAMLSLE